MTIPHEPEGATRFRADLEGLRAIAVVLVVLYHAGATRLSGGYIGVDVFFVLSGYLITGLLVRELRSPDRVSLPSFSARRARRILPASLPVLAVTLVASAIVLSPVHFAATTKDVAVMGSRFAPVAAVAAYFLFGERLGHIQTASRRLPRRSSEAGRHGSARARPSLRAAIIGRGRGRVDRARRPKLTACLK